jgi:GT2 family glycosyltransferase
MAMFDAPRPGVWRARISYDNSQSKHVSRITTLLVTLVSGGSSKTIGWTCVHDEIVIHAVDVPIGTQRLVIRHLQADTISAECIELKWLPVGISGRIMHSVHNRLAHMRSSQGKPLASQLGNHIHAAKLSLVPVDSNSVSGLSDVSVLVPSRDRPYLLEQLFETCFKTVLQSGGEVVIVDHASELPKTRATLERLKSAGCIVVRAEGSFNFSRLINQAARNARRDRLLILNDDVSPQSLQDLEELCQIDIQRSQAIVGPILLYPAKGSGEPTIQHAGMFLGMGGLAGHWLRHLKTSDPMPQTWLRDARQVDGLTGAAIFVTAQLFRQLAGFDERYQVECGDLDFCLRASSRKHKSVVFTKSYWTHPESVSRGEPDTSPLRHTIQKDRRRFWLQWRDTIAKTSILAPPFDPSSEFPKIL